MVLVSSLATHLWRRQSKVTQDREVDYNHVKYIEILLAHKFGNINLADVFDLGISCECSVVVIHS